MITLQVSSEEMDFHGIVCYFDSLLVEYRYQDKKMARLMDPVASGSNQPLANNDNNNK